LGQNHQNLPIFSADDIVRVAADPPPLPVRFEFPNAVMQETWEMPEPQIAELRQKILQILNQEGRSLLAINALVQTQKAEENIARKTLAIRQAEADEIIGKYAQYKALAVAMNPIAVLDLFGGFVTDLFLIRSLARLYGLPITSFKAGQLWQKILISSGSLMGAEIASSVILGFSKTASLLESPGSFTTYASTAFLQGGIAGYTAYIVGQATKTYLSQGCSWGTWGASTVIADILSQVDSQTFVYRILQQKRGQT
jgi:hypothetical protein